MSIYRSTCIYNIFDDKYTYKNKDAVAHLVHSRGHCISFWLSVPPLQVAPRFACSVASLSRYPGR